MLGLQLGRIQVRPDGQHALRGEARADLGKAKVKGQAAGEDLGGQLPRVVGDLLEVAVRVGRVVQPIEQGLDGSEEGGGDFADLGGVELGRLGFEDRVDEVGLLVEKRLAMCGRLACFFGGGVVLVDGHVRW